MLQYTITTDNVCQSIQKLKNNQSDGKHNVFSCNLLNVSNMSFILLSLFFQCMLTQRTIPEEMGLGTFTPIIKNKRKFYHDSNNYRAITLSSIFGKPFHNIIPSQNSSVLNTRDLKFGFKSKNNTVQCRQKL